MAGVAGGGSCWCRILLVPNLAGGTSCRWQILQVADLDAGGCCWWLILLVAHLVCNFSDAHGIMGALANVCTAPTFEPSMVAELQRIGKGSATLPMVAELHGCRASAC